MRATRFYCAAGIYKDIKEFLHFLCKYGIIFLENCDESELFFDLIGEGTRRNRREDLWMIKKS